MAAMSFGVPQPPLQPPQQPPSPPKDNCTPGICTSSCPQFCNAFVFQPPPQQFPIITNIPSSDDDDSSSSSRSISPLMASLIAVLAASFLLLFYYTVLSRFCLRRRHRRRRHPSSTASHRVDPMIHDPARPETGLDEAYIRQITVFKYKRGDGLVEATECAVCLAEFADDESLRLMPNCDHAFHIDCIDTWLGTHSSCPLCRSSMNPLPARSATTAASVGVAALRVERSNDEVVVVDNGADVRIEVVVEVSDDDRLKSIGNDN